MSIQYGERIINLDQLVYLKRQLEIEQMTKNLRPKCYLSGPSAIGFARKLFNMPRRHYDDVYQKLISVIEAEQGK